MPLLHFRRDSRTIAEPVLRRESTLFRFRSIRCKWSLKCQWQGFPNYSAPPFWDKELQRNATRHRGFRWSGWASWEMFFPLRWLIHSLGPALPRYNQNHFPKRHIMLFLVTGTTLEVVTSSRALRWPRDFLMAPSFYVAVVLSFKFFLRTLAHWFGEQNNFGTVTELSKYSLCPAPQCSFLGLGWVGQHPRKNNRNRKKCLQDV